MSESEVDVDMPDASSGASVGVEGDSISDASSVGSYPNLIGRRSVDVESVSSDDDTNPSSSDTDQQGLSWSSADDSEDSGSIGSNPDDAGIPEEIDITGDPLIDELILDDEGMQDVLNIFEHFADDLCFKWNKDRLNWADHVEELLHERQWERMYRMSIEAFNILVDILRPGIAVNYKMSMVSTPDASDRIYPELIVAVGIRWLAGGSYHDIRKYIGISKTSFYRARDMFLDAVLNSNDDRLSFHFPQTEEECSQTEKSLHRVIWHCIGAVDGILLEIRRPSLWESDDPETFFSGHYVCFGFNCQAVCDVHMRFIFFAIAAPGRAGDMNAIKATSFFDLLANVPGPFYILGDNAYPLGNQLLIPFKGAQRMELMNSHFNFYLSQLRIKIEQAFGLFTTKWRILRGNLKNCQLKTVKKVIEVCAKLHNFVLTVDNPYANKSPSQIQPGIEAMTTNTKAGGNLVVVEDEMGTRRAGMIPPVAEEAEELQAIAQAAKAPSLTRDTIMSWMESNAIERPQYNIARNKDKFYIPNA